MSLDEMLGGLFVSFSLPALSGASGGLTSECSGCGSQSCSSNVCKESGCTVDVCAGKSCAEAPCLASPCVYDACVSDACAGQPCSSFSDLRCGGSSCSRLSNGSGV